MILDNNIITYIKPFTIVLTIIILFIELIKIPFPKSNYKMDNIKELDDPKNNNKDDNITKNKLTEGFTNNELDHKKHNSKVKSEKEIEYTKNQIHFLHNKDSKLVFDKDYSLDGDINSGKVEKINLNTCAVKAPKVKINASFKTAGSSSPSLRIQQYTPFINKCQTIIENEITEFTNSLLLEGRFGDALKNIGSKLKDLFTKIVEKIKNFITGICKKGFNVILETFGLEIVSATIKGL